MEHPAAPTGGGARLPGRRLALARAALVVVLALTLGLFAASLPVFAAQLRTPCAGADCYRWQPSPQLAAELVGRGLPLGAYAAYRIAGEALFVLGFGAVAAVLALRRPDEPMALFAALTLVAFGASFSDTIRALALSAPRWWWPRTALACLGWSALFVFFYLFPDGRFVPRWTRWAAVGWAALGALGYFAPPGWAINPGSTAAARDTPPAHPLFSVGVLAFFASVVVAQVHRYRRVSTPAQRQQTKWVVCGFVAAFGGLAANILVVGPLLGSGSPAFVAELVGLADFYAVLLLLPLSIAVAILRYRLWDIDILINRALVYGGLTAGVVGLYVLVVGYLGALFRSGGNVLISLVAAGLVAMLFQPLREHLQRAANRLVYGERDDPYAVLSRLGQRLEGTLAPEAVLPTVVETVREALKLPYAAIALQQDGELTVVAAAGTPVADPLRLPLAYRHEAVGELLLAPRAPGEQFGPADRRLLEDLARQAGVAAHAVRLTADLQRSRERLVASREEERRRLRRDLHDGLGPMLGSLTLKLSVADDLLEQDPAAARALLRGLRTQTQTAIADIRRLVYALRPPALDDLGLIGAVREEAAQYGQSGLCIRIEAPERLPPLAAAVEVAAYRIAQEALTNVTRHARAGSCTVRLTLDEAGGALDLEIADDGRGLPPTRGRGVGLASMRERAAELGGTCVVESPQGPSGRGGTRVRASLPYGGLAELGERPRGPEPVPAPAGREE